MPDYVRVINYDDTYSTICDSRSMSDFGCVNVVSGALPVNNEVYEVIWEGQNPARESIPIMAIRSLSRTEYVIGLEGVIGASEEDFLEQPLTAEERHTSADFRAGTRTAPPQPRVSFSSPEHRFIPPTDKMNIDDLVVVVKPGNPYFDKTFIVRSKKRSGYDYVCSDIGSTQERYGFQSGDLKKYVPKPIFEPGEEPQFSKNELLEILSQDNKSPEEKILDLMDHITN